MSLTPQALSDDHSLLRVIKAWAATYSALRLPPHLRQPIIATRRGKTYTANGFGAIWQRIIKKAVEGDLENPFASMI